MTSLRFIIALTALTIPISGYSRASTHDERAPSSDIASPAPPLPGREQDARVADIAFRLATRGIGHCPVAAPATGLVLQHLSQFERTDRPALIADRSLDRGPGVILVVPGSPAAVAGILPGDVLLAIDGSALPPEQALDLPFAAARAHARADAVQDLLERPVGGIALTLWRAGVRVSARVTPRPACPSRVHLARSGQRNAYADGRHVFLTTGLLALLRDDDELAFFIAHEMGHNILGHAALTRSGAVRRGLGRTLGHSGQIVRASERAADRLAGGLMLDAGFDPVAGAGALQRLDGDGGIAMFAAHDGASARVAAMHMLAQARGSR